MSIPPFHVKNVNAETANALFVSSIAEIHVLHKYSEFWKKIVSVPKFVAYTLSRWFSSWKFYTTMEPFYQVQWVSKYTEKF